MFITGNDLVEQLRSVESFDLPQFLSGPRKPDELAKAINELEMQYHIDRASGKVVLWRTSVRWSLQYTPHWHAEEIARYLHGKPTSLKQRYYTGSGTHRKGETTGDTLLRELLGYKSNAGEPCEMPQLRELLDFHGIILGPGDLDYDTYARFNGPEEHYSSVYLGWLSKVEVTNVVIDLAKVGLPERPFRNGTVAYDLGTFIPIVWEYYEKQEEQSHYVDTWVKKEHPLPTDPFKIKGIFSTTN